MRTTVTLDDEALEKLRREAQRASVPFKTVINRTLRLGIERLQPATRRRAFRQRTFRMGYPPAGNLDKALHIARCRGRRGHPRDRPGLSFRSGSR